MLKTLLKKTSHSFKGVIRYMLRPITTRLRGYLVDGLTAELRELQKVQIISTQELQKAITSTLEKISSGQLIEISEITTSTDLEKLFFEISRNLMEWRQCDLILTCPLTYAGTCTLLKHKNIVNIFSQKDALVQLQESRENRIGITSPWLIGDLLNNVSTSYLLIKSCKRSILFLEGRNRKLSGMGLRKRLHHLGFYEVSQIMGNNVYDFISIGVLAGGEYSLFGSEPAIELDSNEWRTLRAGRLAEIKTEQFQWESISLAPFVAKEFGLVPFAKDFSLAITQQKSEVANKDSCIKATFSWQSGGSGHASLVGCYSGPGDSHMYACLLQAHSNDSLNITLLINDGTWRTISEPKNVPSADFNTSSQIKSISVALHIAMTRIVVRIAGRVLIDIENSDLARNMRVGIRASEGLFSISQIMTN